ncbi:MAG: tRNA (N(6)-L-threonylcarbamoyladenosine(37)-C(2))-methylthiotransferase MtaB [Methylotetracoccus sp.]|nr:tRNA (N(6)-L-threonylcarbamoyladenosine(37)-C(2))-methylthiotransferase MtaB [Methylotetracoccus sp.]
MRVALKSLGCRVNEAELQGWSREFRAAGHQIVDESEPADLVVLNSCAVTEEAVRKSRGLLRRIHREQPQAKVALSGCYASLHASDAESLGVDLIVPNGAKDRLVEITERELNIVAMPALATEPDAASLLPPNRQRAFIKVQDGCRYRCTFCIVTVARGEERSRAIPTIIGEINTLVNAGVQEVVLTGVHLGGYGSDIGSTLADLIRAVLTETDVPRLRLGSLEPWELPDAFFDLFSSPRLMPHLHLPLQSGSDTVLKRMARRCRTVDFAHLLAQARAAVPDVNITTDVIVGFPGETETHWAESLDFIEAMAFGHVHIFGYSPRAGTAAAALPGPVPTAMKKARSVALHERARQMKRAYQGRFLGRVFPVLIEGPDSGQPEGYTPNYMRVSVDHTAGETAVNRVMEIRLTAFDEAKGQLRGEVRPA